MKRATHFELTSTKPSNYIAELYPELISPDLQTQGDDPSFPIIAYSGYLEKEVAGSDFDGKYPNEEYKW